MTRTDLASLQQGFAAMEKVMESALMTVTRLSSL